MNSPMVFSELSIVPYLNKIHYLGLCPLILTHELSRPMIY